VGAARWLGLGKVIAEPQEVSAGGTCRRYLREVSVGIAGSIAVERAIDAAAVMRARREREPIVDGCIQCKGQIVHQLASLAAALQGQLTAFAVSRASLPHRERPPAVGIEAQPQADWAFAD
jgi:hypothetical protein